MRKEIIQTGSFTFVQTDENYCKKHNIKTKPILTMWGEKFFCEECNSNEGIRKTLEYLG